MNKLAAYRVALSGNNLWDNDQEKEASIMNLMAGAALSGQPVDTSMLDAANNVPEIVFNYDSNTLNPTSVQGPSNLVSGLGNSSPIKVNLPQNNPSGVSLQPQSSVFTNSGIPNTPPPLSMGGEYMSYTGGGASVPPTMSSIPTNVDVGPGLSGKLPKNPGGANVPPPPAAANLSGGSTTPKQLPSVVSNPSASSTTAPSAPQGQGLFTNKNIATAGGAVGGGIIGNVAGGAIGSRFGSTEEARRRNARRGRIGGTIVGGIAGAKGLRSLVK